MEPRRGPLTAGEKVQFTDRKGKKITGQLVAGGSTQTEHGLILHDDVIGKTEGTVILTVHAKREAQIEELELRDISDHKLRKVLRDLDRQVGELGNTHE